MNAKRIEELLATIGDIVNEGAPWKEKKNAILNCASESDKINLIEFATWFEESEE